MSATPRVVAVVRKASEFVGIVARLSGLGLELTHTQNLLDATLQHVNSAVSVVICDAYEVNWKTAVWAFQRLAGKAAVVFLTRLADERVWLEMRQAGAYDLLEKPYRPEDLRWIVCSPLYKVAFK